MRAKIEGVETKLGANGGKPYYVVNTMGSKITSFDAKFLACLGKEIEVEFGTNDKGYKTIKFLSEVVQSEQQQLPPIPAAVKVTENVVEAHLSVEESLKMLKMEYRAKAIKYALKSAELSKAPLEESKSSIVTAVAEKYFKYITDDSHSE